MEEIIAKQIEKSLGPYKENLIWILLAFWILSLIVQFYYNSKLLKKIERFKNELKKTEIRFSRHSELQIECLKTLYNNVVDLHFAFVSFTKPLYYTHHYFKNDVQVLLDSFISNMDYFHRNKILLTDEIITQIRVIHTIFKKVEEVVLIEKQVLLDFEEFKESSDPQDLYITPDNETTAIRAKIDKILEVHEVSTFENELNNLRKLVEDYFRTLTK